MAVHEVLCMFEGLSCCKFRVAVFAMQNYTADSINYSAPLPRADFEEAMKKYDISESYFLAFGIEIIAPRRTLVFI